MADGALRLLKLRFDLRRLLSGRHRESDMGYVVHGALAGLFGELAPQPFSVQAMQSERWLTVLAYSDASLQALREHAERFSQDCLAWQAVDWALAADRPMPASWPLGLKMAFEVRLCPTVRQSSGGDRPGREVDAWLAACHATDPSTPVDREAIYRAWFEAAVARTGGATLDSAAMTSFHLGPQFRQTQGEKRRGSMARRPDATFSGLLTVTDDAGFTALVRRGVGRHRAFGFGMLLLKPARVAAC